ncbi:hypothetical protein [Nocardia sp. MW-W600-9]
MREYPAATVTLTCRWDRTRYELLDQRSAVLRSIDDAGLLSRFRPLGTTGLRVDFGGWGQAQIDLEGISIYAFTTDETQPAARPSVEHVAVTIAGILGVESISVTAAFQHVVGWEISEPEHEIEELTVRAQLRGSAAMIAGAADLGVTDFALLIDGAVEEGWSYQAEVGVVAEADVRPRLTRSVGRSAAFAPLELTSETPLPTYPTIATFVDSTWTNAEPWVPLEQATDQVATASGHASRLAEKIHYTVSQSL